MFSNPEELNVYVDNDDDDEDCLAEGKEEVYRRQGRWGDGSEESSLIVREMRALVFVVQ